MVADVVDKGDVKVVIYLDNIVVFVTDLCCVWEETCIILERLAAAGFMVNTAKSKFLVSELKMLGYKLHSGSASHNLYS